MDPKNPSQPISSMPQASAASPVAPVNPVSGNPTMTPPIQAPPASTPAPTVMASTDSAGSGGMSKWFLIIPGLMIVILILLFAGYYMTLNKPQSIPKVMTQEQVPPTKAPTPTPTVVDSAQAQEVNNVDLGNVDTDMKSVDTDLSQL